MSSTGEGLVSEESSSSGDSASTTSWDRADDDEVFRSRAAHQEAVAATAALPRHFSFAEHSVETLTEEADSVHNSKPKRTPQPPPEADPVSSSTTSAASSNVPPDQERQLLLLMLLAQVCALHDPTPRTFTVHVLELFERGILDRESIHFLYSLGLVPSASSTPLLLPPSQSSSPAAGTTNATAHQQGTTSQELAVVTTPTNQSSQPVLQHQRSIEVTAIRNTLEQQEKNRLLNSDSNPSDHGPTRNWSAENHPLSLSRYQREFDQVGLLSSGAFGHVYQATNKMDGRDYAIKRVPFSETGYSQESVQQVVREVHCLAVCDHPHVVRYFTSWLEPSWMTGSGAGAAVGPPDQQKLLTDIEDMVKGEEVKKDELHAYFKDASTSRRRRTFSLGNSLDDVSERSWADDGEEVSEWTVEERSKDDSYIGRKWRQSSSKYLDDDVDEEVKWGEPPKPQRKSPERKSSYRYQICLFIQMQLCHTATLADWIRERNERNQSGGLESRVGPAAEIFSQIARGLKHVHKKEIIHRDLKPANVFAASEDGVQFKIGDFGLSRLIQTAAEMDASSGRRQPSRLMLECEPRDATILEDKYPVSTGATNDKAAWTDPLTAGVGTASYASPEQVASHSYGKEADIFSLGLMLLELLCCFSTEHERLQTFHDCRHRRSLPSALTECPMISRTILGCTEPDPKKRPSAEDLVGIDIRNDLQACGADASLPDATLVQQLQAQLSEKDREIERYKQSLVSKDRIIGELRAEMEKLQGTGYNTKRVAFPASPIPLAHTYTADREGDQGLQELTSSASSSTSSSDEEI